ncbi:hypothetical protein EV356DRAFT_314871 [Viridothelium virens]|uniref:Zn(2)-C6 fungal-type domain-containing protein n=1 Tax=Viridothelium virens TaxID=1048519 RepID=A0A6A6GZW7_VIRVR|nr:hypothetical protein EV356DRAFT_314871 [Viridothelium virens]
MASTQGRERHHQSNRRRPKPQVSCNFCRRRKLKCNRGQPCETCAHRGLSQSCKYSGADVAHVTSQSQSNYPAPIDMQARVDELEAQVISLKVLLNAAKPASLNNAESNEHENAQWTAILDRIGELKDYFRSHSGANPLPNESEVVANPAAQDHSKDIAELSSHHASSEHVSVAELKRHPNRHWSHLYVPVAPKGMIGSASPFGTGMVDW